MPQNVAVMIEQLKMSDTLSPLVVDLDGTLTPTDTLVESVVRYLKSNPFGIVGLVATLVAGRAALKDKVASEVDFSAAQLPYREDFLDYLRQQRLKGRRVILATAAHRTIANDVAGHLGLFDEVIATEDGRNLKGGAKLKVIQERIGERFVYAGDSSADLPIWEAAEAAVLVGVSSRTAATVRKGTRIEREFPAGPTGARLWLKALRVYQWVKNLLIFVPLLTSFGFVDPSKVLDACLAFLAFSFAASATYVLNDLWDIDNDRQHPRKRKRAFASGLISIPRGLVASASLLVLALLIANAVGAKLLFSLVLYIILTSAYSWVLKTYVLIDVFTLSLLYTLRIMAGSAAIEVATSSWLLAFSAFLFFSLAIVKRCSELVTVGQSGLLVAQGRDYRASDLVVLWPLGIASSLSAIVVFGLYISAADTQSRYASPELLWLVGAGLLYWMSRMWIKTARSEMHDDPIVFALRDFGSRVTVVCMIAVTLAAYFTHLRGV